MSKLEEARVFEQEWKSEVDRRRPVFHLTPTVGWMNDPNGFSRYKDKYHLFYQYYPYDVKWGPMYWGHAVSDDLIRWERRPVALAPDEPYESGCYSGTAAQSPEYGQVLMYTAHLVDRSGIVTETQCIAYGDGENFRKFPENPVIRTEQLPEGMRASDFRDPKIFRDDDTWYALIVCMDEDGYGNALLYSSKDLKKWTYVNTILKSEDALGRMWECPDIFKMEEKTVMLLSAVEMEATRDFVHHNGHEVLYLVGNYDKEKHEFEPESYGCVDAGLDFYAPQTVEAPDGRRIMIGWIGSWQNAVTPKELPFNGMMSVPRELSVRDGRLYQTPVREIENYYTDTVERTAIIGMKKVMLEDVEGRIADIEMEIRGRDFDSFTICIAENDRYETVINYDKRDRLLTFDRLFSGNRKDSLNMRTMPVTAEKELFRLRLILDRYSVEIFADDGAEVMTSTIFTPLEADGISFVCDGRAELSVVKHGIRVDQE